MPLTEAEAKALIATQLDQSDDSAFASLVTSLWTLYDDQTNTRIRFLYAKRNAIEHLLAVLDESWSRSEGYGGGSVTEGNSKGRTLLALLASVKEEIASLGGTSTISRAPAIGEIERKAPILREDTLESPTEAHSRIYRGDPLYRS